jgi:hypothetical protein
MTDQLTAALDRFVADQRSAVPPIADVRSRATQRRRRRLAVTSTAVVVAALLAGGGLWALQAERPRGSLVVADGEVVLGPAVSLTWLPDDVASVRFDGTNRPEAMETFGYWEGHYSLHRRDGSIIQLSLTLGDPFDIGAEIATRPGPGPATVVDGRVVVSAADGTFNVVGRVMQYNVRALGNDTAVLGRLIDGIRIDTDIVPMLGSPTPGDPVLLTSGTIDGIPWDLRVTVPSQPISTVDLDAGGACLVLRTYQQGQACLQKGVEWVTVLSLPFSRADETVPPDLIWIALTETPATAFEYTLSDGTEGRVDAEPASPATGRFGVIDSGAADIVEVRALNADGTVIQTSDPARRLAP